MNLFFILALIPLILSIGITPALSFDFIPISEGYGSGDKPDPRVCGEKLCSEIPGGRDAWESQNVSDTKVSSEENKYVKALAVLEHKAESSPKKQMKNGVAAEDVVCKSEFTLMIRISGDAACVTPTTAEKLEASGWGTIQR